MATYTNIKCGSCNRSLTGGYVQSGIKSNLGMPFVECPSCGRLNATGKTPWSQMSSGGKVIYILGRAFQSLINGCVILSGLLVLFWILPDSVGATFYAVIGKSGLAALIWLFVIAQLISGLIIYYNSKSLINKVESVYQSDDYSNLTV